MHILRLTVSLAYANFSPKSKLGMLINVMIIKKHVVIITKLEQI